MASRDGLQSHEEGQPANKFSRYRSLRGRTVSATASAVGGLAIGSSSSSSSADKDDQHRDPAVDNGQLRHSTTSGNPISRSMSMSRYRRRANSVTVGGDATQAAQKSNAGPPHQPASVERNPPMMAVVPPVPAIPPTLRSRSSRGDGGSRNSLAATATASASNGTRRTEQKEEARHADATKASLGAPSPPSTPPPPPPPPLSQRRPRPRHTSEADSQGHDIAPLRHGIETITDNNQSRPGDESQQQQRRKMADLDERRIRLKEEREEAEIPHADQVARLQAETNLILAEQKRKDLERLQVQLANCQQTSLQSPKTRSPVIEKFAFLTKGRKYKNDWSPALSPTTPSSAGASISEVIHRTTTIESGKAVPTGIEAGGRGIVPQTDAPVSAINSGDRLDVTPDTTTADILSQTSKKMTYDLEISPSKCVVIESYVPLGLERRLRRYERIRDVMNSWDQGSQNYLLVAVSEPGDDGRDLDVASVPGSEQPPSGVQLYMYHSNRPGKWNKRWVTLLDNGQIFCAKKPNTRSSDKDATSLCRLSDYDIYTPTESQVRKHLRPPKKYCFAVKSQQKTTVFMNTENYMQLFCTEDPDAAAQFRGRVQGWRSWYLVDRRPEAKKPASSATAAAAAAAAAAGAAAAESASVPAADEKAPQIMPVRHVPKKSANVASINGHRLKVSVDETPYTIGEFEPLLDMKRFDKRLSQFGRDFLPPPPPPGVPDASTMPRNVPAQFREQRQQQQRATPAAATVSSNSKERDGGGSSSRKADSSSFSQKKQQKGKLIDTIESADSAGFTGGGLLGEGYEERRQAQATEANNSSNNSNNNHHHHSNNNGSRSRSLTTNNTNLNTNTAGAGPFTDGNTLLNRPPPPPDSPARKPESPSWFPSALEHSAKQRTTTTTTQERQQQRPSTSAGVMRSSQSRRPSAPFIRSQQAHVHERPPPSSGAGAGADAAHPNPLRSSPYLGPVGGAMSHSNRRERPRPLVDLGPGKDDGAGTGTGRTNEQQQKPPPSQPLPPPQWRDRGGRGVVVPEGMHHIIDLISVSGNNNNGSSSSSSSNNNNINNKATVGGGSTGGGGGGGTKPSGATTKKGGFLVDLVPSPSPSPSPSRGITTTIRAGASHLAPLPLSRTRSKTAGAPPPVSLRGRGGGGDGAAETPPLPPLPPLPLPLLREAGGGSSTRDREREREHRDRDRDRAKLKEKEREREKRREREKKEREEYCEREAAFNAVPGRTGTLKVV